ncbi:MAG TPA: carboxypeptidase-like regulatory domain-containing protein, partial [Gemmatimonadales bacterium]|nr:carboxypeptidase-like regulatory domain-containing protein [Gemmatimonadales bacterium]
MRRVWTSLVALAVGFAAEALGQESEFALHRPRFLAVASAGGERVDASSAAVLRRHVTLALAGVTVEDALKEIARQANLELMFTKAVLPPGRAVSLHAADITVGAALTQALWDTGLDVLLLPGGQMGLVQRPAPAPVPAATGTVLGRVTDARTGQGLEGAEVLLERTRWRAVTGEEGRYRLEEIEPGSYTLSVRRIGYAKQTHAVTLASDEETTVDIALEPVVTQLDEVVTTATGEQRRLELGHVVGRINADSLVKEAPISDLTELLTARVPG